MTRALRMGAVVAIAILWVPTARSASCGFLPWKCCGPWPCVQNVCPNDYCRKPCPECPARVPCCCGVPCSKPSPPCPPFTCIGRCNDYCPKPGCIKVGIGSGPSYRCLPGGCEPCPTPR